MTTTENQTNVCPQCGCDVALLLGILGETWLLRCRACGWDRQHTAETHGCEVCEGDLCESCGDCHGCAGGTCETEALDYDAQCLDCGDEGVHPEHGLCDLCWGQEQRAAAEAWLDHGYEE